MGEKWDCKSLEKDFPAVHKFLSPNTDDGDLDNFLRSVSEIESIIKDLSASEKTVSEDGLERAEKYLERVEEKRRLKEATEGKTKFSRTVLNRDCLKDSQFKLQDGNSNSLMSRDVFMSLMERDAAERAVRRKQRESEK